MAIFNADGGGVGRWRVKLGLEETVRYHPHMKLPPPPHVLFKCRVLFLSYRHKFT